MCLIRRWFKYKFFLRKYKLTCNDKNFWLKSDHIQTFGVHNNQLYKNSCYETTNMYSVNKVPFSVNTPINVDLYLHKNSFIHIWTSLVQYPFKISKRLCSNLFASRFKIWKIFIRFFRDILYNKQWISHHDRGNRSCSSPFVIHKSRQNSICAKSRRCVTRQFRTLRIYHERREGCYRDVIISLVKLILATTTTRDNHLRDHFSIRRRRAASFVRNVVADALSSATRRRLAVCGVSMWRKWSGNDAGIRESAFRASFSLATPHIAKTAEGGAKRLISISISSTRWFRVQCTQSSDLVVVFATLLFC